MSFDTEMGVAKIQMCDFEAFFPGNERELFDQNLTAFLFSSS
jgi:hypothetical protein